MGPRGFNGTVGPMGPRGVNGTHGPPGSPGPRGPMGPSGVNGSQGPQGVRGVQGSMGPPGYNATQGNPGAWNASRCQHKIKEEAVQTSGKSPSSVVIVREDDHPVYLIVSLLVHVSKIFMFVKAHNQHKPTKSSKSLEKDNKNSPSSFICIFIFRENIYAVLVVALLCVRTMSINKIERDHPKYNPFMGDLFCRTLNPLL